MFIINSSIATATNISPKLTFPKLGGFRLQKRMKCKAAKGNEDDLGEVEGAILRNFRVYERKFFL